jgi:hypothetical protein
MPQHSDVTDYNTFLKVLWQFSGIKNQGGFAQACGRHPANMGRYINGNLRAGEKVAKASFNAYRKWYNTRTNINLFKAITEISDLSKVEIPTSSGIYMLYNSSAQVIYIGQAQNLKTEVGQTLKRHVPIGVRMGPDLKKTKPTIHLLAKYISLYQIDDQVLRANMEALLIRVSINHTHNANLGHFRKS